MATNKYINNFPSLIDRIDYVSRFTRMRSIALQDCNRVAPYDTGRMVMSSLIDGDVISYNTPYAAKNYYTHKTKSFWIEKTLYSNSDRYIDILKDELSFD